MTQDEPLRSNYFVQSIIFFNNFISFAGARGTQCQKDRANKTLGMIFGIIGGIVGLIVLCVCAVYFYTEKKEDTSHTAMQVHVLCGLSLIYSDSLESLEFKPNTLRRDSSIHRLSSSQTDLRLMHKVIEVT